MGIQVKDSNRLILARMFNKIQLTVFTLLVFVCCVVIFPIHCECLQWKLGVIDLNLLPEFPYKSFIFTAILNYST